MRVYPYTFEPIYVEKIWGGRNLERLFGRQLPAGRAIGESWELADLREGTSVVFNGPEKGRTLTELTRELGPDLLGRAPAHEDGRFPLLLKLLDANDILSLQVHPDEAAVAAIGPPAALKTECWYVLESRDGMIYKGMGEGVTPEQFRSAVESDWAEQLIRRHDVATGDFHYLPAGTVHALGAGVVVAEVQTPSDTTYRVTDWGRGREIHVERSMQCIHFEPTDDVAPGAGGRTLLDTDYFRVDKCTIEAGQGSVLAESRCTAVMVLAGQADVAGGGDDEPVVSLAAGDALLIPAALEKVEICETRQEFTCLVITLPEN